MDIIRFLTFSIATVRSLEDGFQELVATVDGNEIVVNESSIRTHLQLDDKGGLYVFTQQEILKRMVALIKRKRQARAEQLAKERRERPLTQAHQKEYMQTFVKNQSSALYITGWTMTHRTLPRSKPTLEEPSFRKFKPTEISSVDAVASQVSAAGTQDPAVVTISSSVVAARTPDVSAKSSSTSPLPASFFAAFTTPPSTNLSSPPLAAVTDTTTTSLPAEPNPAHPICVYELIQKDSRHEISRFTCADFGLFKRIVVLRLVGSQCRIRNPRISKKKDSPTKIVILRSSATCQ
ncbi:hypothetical protein Tco_0828643 [Tanacetum coccineum]